MKQASRKGFLISMLLSSLIVTDARAAAAARDPWQAGSPTFGENSTARPQRPMLLYFTAKWCGYCQQMQRTTLAEPAVMARLRTLRAYQLDFDAESGLARRFGVSGIPAFVLTNERGDVIDQIAGASPPVEFLAWLAKAEAEFVTRAKTAAAVLEALRTLSDQARAADVSTRVRAVETLWTLAGRAAESEREAATKILTALLVENAGGAIWRAGLGHADLAVRVAAANLLRQITGGKQNFDPWADEIERGKALLQLAL